MPCPFPQRIIWLRSCAPWVRAWCCTLVAHEGPLVILFARNIWKETGEKRRENVGKGPAGDRWDPWLNAQASPWSLHLENGMDDKESYVKEMGRKILQLLDQVSSGGTQCSFALFFPFLVLICMKDHTCIYSSRRYLNKSEHVQWTSKWTGPHQFLKIVRRLPKLVFCQKHMWWMWMVNHQKFSGDEIKGALCPALEFLILLPSPS